MPSPRSLRESMDREPNGSAQADVFARGGEMAERIAAFDWANTVLGPVERWPESLKAAVRICVASRNPMVLWWGKSTMTQIYNDAYISILGAAKHPQWLGRSGRECWAEIMETMGPMWEHVFTTGEATWSEDFLYVLNRELPREEGYFTFSYTPLWDDGGNIAGIICPCHETTGRVIGERRLRILRDLGRTVAAAKTAEAACKRAASTLAGNPADIPFALVYLVGDDAQHARLVAATGIRPGCEAAPSSIDLGEPAVGSAWPLRRVLDTASPVLLSDLAARFGPLPGGPWPESTHSALILPIAASGQARPIGFVIAGLSPRRVVDADYRSFFDLVAGHVATAIANARAYEAERKRAEALAEIDRAKTIFFSNVSHEFRTPLTLVLGPIAHALAEDQLSADARKRLQLAQRNGVRLLKLVNTLLDFSRIEAGRVQAVYQPTDLATFTAELASLFESATYRAGLELRIECPPLAEPVYVDREMWEKIVLNLTSNAFKFTFEGAITVGLADRGDNVELTVKDTGVGIAESDLPRIFERFHRVEGTRGRSFEGSGIGLALVQELVKLHAGNISVESAPDRGSAFKVSIPKGRKHLPQDRIEADRTAPSTALHTDAYVEEVLSWIAPPETHSSSPQLVNDLGASVDKAAWKGLEDSTVLLADDNSDMRQYLQRLLERRYRTVAVSNGKEALDAALARQPDLIIADAMMPVLDGFGLLRAVRANPKTLAIPVVMLSARAGEESQVEGLQAGADDYLVKPFSARELLARVTSLLRLNKVRREAARVIEEREEQLRRANAELAGRVAELRHANLDAENSRRATLNLLQDTTLAKEALQESEERFRMMADNIAQLAWTCDRFGEVTWYNRRWLEYTGLPFHAMRGWDWSKVLHPDHLDRVVAGVERSAKTGEPWEDTFPLRGQDGDYRWFLSRAVPIREADGKVVRWFGTNTDITEQRKAEEALREAQRLLERSHAELESLVKQRTAAVRRLSSEMIRSQDEERRRISRELHDSVGQFLAHAKMSIEALMKPDAPEKEANALSHVCETLAKCLAETRTISYLLHPPLLDEVGLASAARWYADGFSERSGIQVNLNISNELTRLPGELELVLFRVLQESLTNVHRHSQTRSVDVQVRVDAGEVTLEVRDHGKGIPQESLRRFQITGEGAGVGLNGMRERIADLGGSFEIQSDNKGTLIRVAAPISEKRSGMAARG